MFSRSRVGVIAIAVLVGIVALGLSLNGQGVYTNTVLANDDDGNLSIAAVGGFGQAADDIPLDIPGATVARISVAIFNSLTPTQLRAQYDVLIFSWFSPSTLNADWNTRLLPWEASKTPNLLASMFPRERAGHG